MGLAPPPPFPKKIKEGKEKGKKEKREWKKTVGGCDDLITIGVVVGG